MNPQVGLGLHQQSSLSASTSTQVPTIAEATATTATPQSQTKSSAQQRFAQCALIEIIHLHDCLRGALEQIQRNVQTLVIAAQAIESNTSNINNGNNVASSSASTGSISSSSTSTSSTTLGQVQASSSSTSTLVSLSSPAKTNDVHDDVESTKPPSTFDIEKASDISNSIASRFHLVWSVFQAHSGAEDEFIWPALKMKIHSKTSASEHTKNTPSSISIQTAPASSSSSSSSSSKCGCEKMFEQEIYEEDHEIEQTMFKQIHTTLRRLQGAFRLRAHVVNALKNNQDSSSSSATSTATIVNIHTDEASCLAIIKNVIHQLQEHTQHLHQHLLQHLEKEETQCLPMVQRHLSNEEISTLVGNIMGQRSADLMTKILNLAVCSLPRDERQDLLKHMKKAMVGTFFEKWLSQGGWEEMQAESLSTPRSVAAVAMDQSTRGSNNNNNNNNNLLFNNIHTNNISDSNRNQVHNTSCNNSSERIPMSNQSTDCTTSCQSSLKRSRESDHDNDLMDLPPAKRSARHHNDTRLRFPAKYFVKKKRTKKVSLIWSSEKDKSKEICTKVPQFTISELTPTYHYNEDTGGMVLGCEHYQRGCKLRHPKTGELFTCRLCCDEVREKYRYGDEALPQLDRYNVKEVMCMKCGSLQPAGKSCQNKTCEAYGNPFAKHFCNICHLYDDSGTDIYHCPYCNVCRKGKGLGIDFRHCMRCNACVSINEPHKCIPQRLQGNCPICHEQMFESTEPLRGLKCGHVMHLSCFNEYMARSSLGKLSCPLCKLSFGDMRG